MSRDRSLRGESLHTPPSLRSEPTVQGEVIFEVLDEFLGMWKVVSVDPGVLGVIISFPMDKVL
jgi:hypothetical protein